MILKTPLTINQLLNIIQADVIVKGDQSAIITGVNEIHSVVKGDVSFVDHPKYYERMMKSEASVIIIDQEVEFPEGKTLLITKDPLQAYLNLVNYLVHFNSQTTPIHPSAKIGEGTIIQPCTFVGEDVVIGKNCLIHSNVSIYAHSVIGDNVIIHSGSVIGADACYFQKRDDGWLKLTSCGRTVIGNDVEIGCCVTIDRGVSGDTYVGDGSKFDNLVQIGHDTYIGKHCLFGAQSAIAGCTHLEDECTIWAKSVVNKDLFVAKRTTLLALSGIDKDVTEEGSVLFGAPAYEVRKKWREMACSKLLPDMMEEFKKLKQEVAELKALQNK
jgi:UDP-3-O-[3-hydroxymyristoyl] glucosamine N-acyltransferase